jgi:hypothetical protein
MLLTQEINQSILEKRVKLFNENKDPRIGDYIKLPYGIYMPISIHLYDNLYQISCGGSFYLGNLGGLSFSGGLDESIDISTLKLTKETNDLNVWFFSENEWAAHNGVYFKIKTRVYTLPKNENFDRFSVIRKYKENLFLSKCETVSRINGNGNVYVLPVPKLVIVDDAFLPMLETIKNKTNLDFNSYYNFWKSAQPKTVQQVNKVIEILNAKCSFHNNSDNKNTLFLFSEKHYFYKKYRTEVWNHNIIF